MATVMSRGTANYSNNKLGIEVNDDVTWQGWEPGGEYTKNIVLKNVQVKTQKLKYKGPYKPVLVNIYFRGPSTRFFTTLYPKPIVLSSGTSFTLPVTFRPLEKDQYEDQIEFETNDGAFKIPMRAVLPKADVTIPEAINFNMCAVKDSVDLTFEVKNTSELMSTFHWDVPSPFTFVPLSGTLAPGTTYLIKGTFSPKAAMVYEAVAVCKYSHTPDNVSEKAMKIEGIGSAIRDLSAHSKDSQKNWTFGLPGHAAAMVYEAVAVCKYSHTPDNVSEKAMKIEGIGKFPHLIVGRSPGAKAFTENEDRTGQVTVDFGSVPIQTTKTKWIELQNVSPVNAPFQILQPSYEGNIDTVFTCSHYHGVVGANSATKIKISYSPHTPSQQSVDYLEVVALGATNCSLIKCKGTCKGPEVCLDTDCLDFTVVESGKQIARTFKVVNNSAVPAAFQFLIDCAQSVFKLNSTCGCIPGGESKTIIAYFTPAKPINYYRQLVCLVQNQDPLFVDLIGTCHTEQVKPGKFPHLIVSRSPGAKAFSENEDRTGQVTVDFGSVPIQTTKTKWIELQNVSPVNAPFQILQPSYEGNIDTVFTCSHYHGVVGANSATKIKISYSPHTPSQQSVDYLEVVALGATNCSLIKCKGTCKGPEVCLDTDCLDFTVVESGKQIARTFKVVNNSAVPAAFQFLIDCAQSVFKLNSTCGCIPGGESKTIIAYFTPAKPINYYRQLVCLVQNQDPLFVDLIGTCHTEQVKPAPLRKKHLERFRINESRGLTRIPPEQLNNLLLEKKLRLDEQGAVEPIEGVSAGDCRKSHPKLSRVEQLFNDGSYGDTVVTFPHVSLDINCMEFGRVPHVRVEQKTVNITNHTKGKIVCTWMQGK
ncbi:predicted protein [Nematostella vectensis]|uniref:Uncharacterized protein n=1 Tax=Nematostella vectensis TaxID=45351 RepID=A7S3B1_NEMVE|nr:predicted protein [Nematostella vectensis]|eukprot:XP_001633918.1 predicted protein [Nematostella vectensis]